MKLSTAIRKGSKGKTQGFGRHWDPKTGAVCALGAARIGAGQGPCYLLDPDSPSIYQIFPDAWTQIETEDGNERIISLIGHFNDTLRWSFGEIADWLDYYGY